MMMMMMMMTMMMLTMTFAIAYRLQDGVTFSPDPMHRDVQPADNVAATFQFGVVDILYVGECVQTGL